MYTPPDRFFVYRTRVGATSLPFGHTEWGAIWSLDARRGGRRLGLKALRKGQRLGTAIREGSLLLLLGHSAAKRPPRREVVYPYVDNGKVVERKTPDLAAAVHSLLAEIDQYGDALAIEYGMLMNLRDPVLRFVGPHRFAKELSREEIETSLGAAWSRYYTGVQFADDPHCYSFWSAYGMLDRIKHDPESLDEIERTDIRTCTDRLRPVNGGHLDFFSQVHDLAPLISGLSKLRTLLARTPDETVSIMGVPGEKERMEYLSVYSSLEPLGFWPIPED